MTTTMQTGPPTQSLSKGFVPNIVLVEDNPGDVYLFERAMAAHGIDFVLTLYMNGRIAVRAIRDPGFITPDLILVDLNLPLADGFDVLSSIQKAPGLAAVPVAVLAASNSARDREWASLHEVDKYIHKPAVLEEYIEQVGSAVRELLEAHA
jgi:CheY-like chemotaxis protein